ncbi:hypothetical protein KCP78_19915 [Salmonella enterica subsp. enterica]|nr:hypothetical protein KCP78_19915 [Salmonella enterica subsp. enterica]
MRFEKTLYFPPADKNAPPRRRKSIRSAVHDADKNDRAAGMAASVEVLRIVFCPRVNG